MEMDSWIDSSMHEGFSWFGEFWENVTIFFRRFRVYGFKRGCVEVACETLTIGLAGSLLMLMLALPAFEMTETDWRRQNDFSVEFLDRFGNPIGRRGIRHSDAEPIDALPDHFIKAVLATEDRRFFEHYGIDFFGLTRALVENARANSVVQGGSTITQQLAKNLFLTNERTIQRKINEAFLSVWLEFNLSKKEILKLYLDRAYMGGGNFGVAAASDFYFQKNITDVNLAEASMLAGLYKAPTKYAPHINLPAARARANEVLTNMVQAEFMTEGQVIGARRNPARIIEREDGESPNYFLDWAFEEVQRIARYFPTHTLIAKTTIDMGLQRAADDSIESHLRQYGDDFKVKQASMVVIERGGAVRAIVGGRDYGVSQYNRATRARRQPGSSFKPFVYATAMKQNPKFGPRTVVYDQPVRIGKWSPRNYSGGYAGRTNVTTALVKSINTIPVILARQIGRRNIADLAHEMGIESELRPNPSMPLGTNEVTAMEMATGYGVFMEGGYKPDRHGIVQITDAAGNLLYDQKKEKPAAKLILEEAAVRSMNQILSQVPQWGTARRAQLVGIPSAGKTGTTQSYRDAWFVGYTGNYVAAIWYGNDNYGPTNRLTGGRLPAMTWRRFMTYAHQNIDIKPIPFLEGTKPLRPAIPPPAVGDEFKPIEVRQKLLSRKSFEILKELEQKMRNAKPLKFDSQLAQAIEGGSTGSVALAKKLPSKP